MWYVPASRGMPVAQVQRSLRKAGENNRKQNKQTQPEGRQEQIHIGPSMPKERLEFQSKFNEKQ